MNADAADRPNVETTEILLKELEIFEESIWRNEEIGEKRFNFFITLLSAVAAGIAALWSAASLSSVVEARRNEISAVACVVLLIFGFVTYMRMKQRDRVTAQYKRSTWYIRTLYRAAFPQLRRFKLPRPKDPAHAEIPGYAEQSHGDRDTRWDKFCKGGYTISLGVLNGLLLSIALMFAFEWKALLVVFPFAVGVLFSVILCWYGSEPFPSWEASRPEWPAR